MLVQERSIQSIREVVATDFKAVDQLILQSLHSDVSLTRQVSNHIVKSGGKRLRPLVVLLVAKALNYAGKDHIVLAAIIEFIHTATLLHDDVVDGSQLRRGRPTANALWGNEASILVGDFLYSRSFQMMTSLKQLRVMEVLANTTNIIAEGEVMQLMHRNNPDADEAYYMQMIRLKTAKLFEAAAKLGCIIAQSTAEQENALATYGLHLGTAFQLIDDVLDYSANKEELGKNLGQDLAEGKPTLPLIYAMQTGTRQQTQLIRTAIQQRNSAPLDEILHAIQSTHALDHARKIAAKEIIIAIEQLKIIAPSQYHEALINLAHFATERTN